MIPNVELAKELVTHVDDGRQCVVPRAQNSARRDARLQSDRRHTVPILHPFANS